MARTNVELKVEGMTCQGCVRSIEKKLAGVAGVERAQVNLGAGMATVEYDDARTDPGQLIVAVETIGFQARQFQGPPQT
ncbi:MAG: heavy metal-associated domain-containing protein [Bryobacteraceae bacterium]|jgi:copper chaperone CopZ